jgi:hypothetical protein
MLQPPQFLGSVLKSMQSPLQVNVPPPHTVAQTPCEHTRSEAHALPQPPQFCESLCVLVHVPPHICAVPGPHGLGGPESAPPSPLVALFVAQLAAARADNTRTTSA